MDIKDINNKIIENIKTKIARMQGRAPCLAVLLVGDHTPSRIYVSRKIKACTEVGITSIVKELPATITENELLQQVKILNENHDVDGILIQLPLPPHINTINVIQYIDPSKDVDGLHPINAGKLLIGETDGFVPCTPLGIKVLLEQSNIPVAGKHVVILGRSNLVGRPLAALLLRNAPSGNATVTVAHSHTQNLKAITNSADILVAAIGKPLFVTADMVKKGAVVIDVGINKLADPSKKSGFRIVGDTDYDALKEKCAYITPVPGGVGPMTIAMLLSNTLQAKLNH